jgi:hypothetical protein
MKLNATTKTILPISELGAFLATYRFLVVLTPKMSLSYLPLYPSFKSEKEK